MSRSSIDWPHRRRTCTSRPAVGLPRRRPSGARAEQLLQLLADDPFRQPPPYEALVGDLRGGFSRRLNIQNRLMYQVLIEERVVKVLRLGTHYG